MIKLNMDKSARPVRSRKHSRRSWTPVQGDTNRPIKRLFTPEIKRMLKDWLVRRRENPYPSRNEKKVLAEKTGLTYIQICNWFANWRRKLKNAGKEPQKNTWGNLIKNYNNNARGNVEQFSICSSDSIWEDEERRNEYLDSKLAIAQRNAENATTQQQQHPIYLNTFTRFDQQNAHVNSMYKRRQSKFDSNDELPSDRKSNNDINYTNEQCYQLARTKFWIDSQVGSSNTMDDNNDKNNNNNDTIITTTTTPISNSTSNYTITKRLKSTVKQLEIDSKPSQSINCFSNPKYKNQIMEKYLSTLDNKGKCELELSKWLESAAKFTPEKNNYIEWDSKRIGSKPDDFQEQYASEANNNNSNIHHQKEELDAAEALTFLAGNFKSQWVK